MQLRVAGLAVRLRDRSEESMTGPERGTRGLGHKYQSPRAVPLGMKHHIVLYEVTLKANREERTTDGRRRRRCGWSCHIESSCDRKVVEKKRGVLEIRRQGRAQHKLADDHAFPQWDASQGLVSKAMREGK